MELGFVEVQNNGPKFTWTNYQEGKKRIYRKLDWCFENQEWFSRKKNVICNIINNSVSDHCGLLLDFQNSKRCKKVPFKFFNMWSTLPNFLRIIERVWNLQIKGSNMYRIYHKLKLLQAELKTFNKKYFDQIAVKVSVCRDELVENKGKAYG